MTGVETTAETTTAITTEEPVKVRMGRRMVLKMKYLIFVIPILTQIHIIHIVIMNTAFVKNGYDGDDGVRFPMDFPIMI